MSNPNAGDNHASRPLSRQERFRHAYETGDLPWDIDSPQPALEEALRDVRPPASVLDLGCGTGENALMLAARGCDVVGVDAERKAIMLARAKAAARKLSARFEVQDVLALSFPDSSFDILIDSGLFHVFSDDERPLYVSSMARVLRPGGRAYVLCFSDAEPGDYGPRRVCRRELESAFGGKFFEIESIEATEFHSRMHETGGAKAWLTTLRRSGEPWAGTGNQR